MLESLPNHMEQQPSFIYQDHFDLIGTDSSRDTVKNVVDSEIY